MPKRYVDECVPNLRSFWHVLLEARRLNSSAPRGRQNQIQRVRAAMIANAASRRAAGIGCQVTLHGFAANEAQISSLPLRAKM